MSTYTIDGFKSTNNKPVSLPKDAPIFVNSRPPPSNLTPITWTSLSIAIAALVLSLIIGGFLLWGTNTTVEATGPAGPKGQKGEMGEKGATGITGIDGAQGIKGDKGESTGIKGDKGQKGEAGLNANIPDGTTEGRVVYWDATNTQWTETKDVVINTAAQRVEIGTNLQLYQPNVPTIATDTGAVGQFSWDANYFYVCVAANTWKRVAIATW